MYLKNAAPLVALSLGLFSTVLHAATLPVKREEAEEPKKVALDTEGDFGNVGELIMAVQDYLQTANAYDPSVPGKCNLYMSTQGGGACEARIQCGQTDSNGPKMLPDPWNVCYVGGRQFFSDPRIGNFSITFTEAGGVNGNTVDGLHTPVLQLENLNNWEPIDIEDVINQHQGPDGNLCEKGGLDADQLLSWTCGIPVIGQAAYGISNYAPAASGGYAPGVCAAHVVQYQKNEFGVGAQYDFDVVLFDNNKKEIAVVQKQAVDSNTLALSVDSPLPYVFVVTAGAIDSSAVTFAYAGQNWKCGDGVNRGSQCDLGMEKDYGYESGNRKGDMTFTC